MRVKDSFLNTYKELFRLGLPVLFAQLGTIVVSLADTMMVGAYGTDELASAAFVNNLILVPMVMQMGFAAGVTPLVGALYGAGRKLEVGQMLRVGLQLNIGLGLLLFAVMGVLYFFLPQMGQDPELLPLIRPYYLIVLTSMLIGGVFFPCMQLCNGVTDTATPMWTIITANALNIAGNYLLIFGRFGAPELGLAGAGISTLTARFMSVIIILTIILTAKRYRPYREGLLGKVSLKLERRHMFNTSWPVMVQSGIECFLWAFGAVVCGWFGKQQLAAYQVVLSIGQLGFLTYMSFCTAVSIKVANCMGSRDFQLMRRNTVAGLHLTLVLATMASGVFLLAGESLIEMFTSDEAVIGIGVTLLLPLIIYQFADAVQMLYANALRGTGHVLPLVGISIVSYVIAGTGSLLLMAKVLDMQAVGVYSSFSAALFVAAFLMRQAYGKAVKLEESAQKMVNNSPGHK